MRTRGVPVAALLLLASLAHQGTGAEDIYWEGEDGSNEFLEVKQDDFGLGSHLRRFKRAGFFDFSFLSPTESPAAENLESVTEDDDSITDTKDDDADTDGSGVPDNRIEPEPREKTLRVTFVVMEPYKNEYSNRDSIQFQNFSKSLADAVNALFESLPGTQKASLVRIQSRLSDEFTCKVTLDIVTTGYEDTDRITQTLRDHIRNRSVLGTATVYDLDFSANVIDPGSTLVTCASNELQCDDGTCIIDSARCDGYRDCGDGSDEANCSTDTYQGPDTDDSAWNGGDTAGANCSNPIPCLLDPQESYCPYQKCDGHEDCPDGNDEVDCHVSEVDNEIQRGDQSLEGEPTPVPEEEDNTNYLVTTQSPACYPGEIRCDETRCINAFQRCDSIPDCHDGTDELGCTQSCGADDFRCDTGKCIEGARRCDRVVDCPNEEDERNCDCTADEFKCVTDGTCIELRKRCDGTSNCKDGSDEEDCVSSSFDWFGHHVCKDRGRFRCGDGTCISILLRCDGFKDCAKDGNDEIGCPCSSDQWQCDHGSCIKRSKRCDGRVDCPTDRSDERNCYATGYFKCRTGHLIPDSLRCNRRYDCPVGDYSDEQNCPCDKGDFKCDNGHCIPASKHCDRTHDCQDGSDERHCTYGTVCMAYQFKCTSGKCVQAESWCNGTAECDDASDETNCPCKRGQFQCHDGSCINIALRCNGRKDCQPAGEDEFNCGTPQCPPGSFTCSSTSSVACARRCDGIPECDGDEDEEGCPEGCNHICDGKCLDDQLICDSKRDCSDGSDELNCVNCDGLNDFRCDNGECIHIDQRCNNVKDCINGDDERDCNYTMIPTSGACLNTQFTCHDGTCIDIQFVCDGHVDCNDDSDEENCPCDVNSWQCRSGQCIPYGAYCDGNVDCDDSTDEINCTLSATTHASPSIVSTTSSPVLTTTQRDFYDRPRQPYPPYGVRPSSDPNRPGYGQTEDPLNPNPYDPYRPDWSPNGPYPPRGPSQSGSQGWPGYPGASPGTYGVTTQNPSIPNWNDPSVGGEGNRPTGQSGSDGGNQYGNGPSTVQPYPDNTEQPYDGNGYDQSGNEYPRGDGGDQYGNRYPDVDGDDDSDSRNVNEPTDRPQYGGTGYDQSGNRYPDSDRDGSSPTGNGPTDRPQYGGAGYDQSGNGYPTGNRPTDRPQYGGVGYDQSGNRYPDSDRDGSSPTGNGPTDRPQYGGAGYDQSGNGYPTGNRPTDRPQYGGVGYDQSGNRYPDGDRDGSSPTRNRPTERPQYGGAGYDQSGNGYPDGDRDGNSPTGNGPPDRPKYGGAGYDQSGNGYPDGDRDGNSPTGNGPTDRPQYGGAGYDQSGNGYPDGDRDGNSPTGNGPTDRPQYGGAGYDQSGNGYPDGDRDRGTSYRNGATNRPQQGSSGYDQSGNRYPGGSGSDGSTNVASGGSPYGGDGDSRYENGATGGGRYDSDRNAPSGGNQNGGDGNNQFGGGQYGGNGYEPSGGDQYGANGGNQYGFEAPGGGGGSGQSGNTYPAAETGDGNGAFGNRPSGRNEFGSGNSGGVCGQNQWRCENGPCIDYRTRCDGRIDCPYDGSDEFDCPPGPSNLALRTVPDEQVIRYVHYGGDAVFQCRDEGPLRVPVRWIREGGRQLKPGSIDRKGRLELFKVTPSDSGVYVCQAVRFTGYPGSEVRVTLNVEAQPSISNQAFMPCKPDEATCGNGRQCIPKSATCNGQIDCDDGSDEDSCYQNGMCEPNQYQCRNHKCVLKTWLCDSEDDCGDGSDEADCNRQNPGDPCLSVEFACSTGGQCVPKSFHCDGQPDCLDNSDEIGCAPIYVTQPPTPSLVTLDVGSTLKLTCHAVGVPVPLISWRLNWGHVPPQCVAVSENGTGTLTCPDMQHVHSGAYSCEAINNKGTTFAIPDSIVFVNKSDPCPPAYFNSEARTENECIRCFCFGKSQRCHSADLFLYNMPTPLGQGGTRLVGVSQAPTGDVRTDTPIGNQYHYEPQRNGASVTKMDPSTSSWSVSEDHPYVTLPESYNGKQLTSYGGHIKYVVNPHSDDYSPDDSVPTIIIKGKYGNLFHYYRGPVNREIVIEARLTPENWMKPSPRGIVPASREDIMMTLDHVEMILLRADLNNAGVIINDFTMESAQSANVGLGAASLVEECTCPRGYDGLSCEKCAFGFTRTNSDPWHGDCVPETCPPGTYGDPENGLPCSPCPCPLTSPGNQFASTCSLGPNGVVVCDCHPGYEGIHCDYCAPGYVGNPLIPGDSCKPKKTDNCNPIGTRNIRLPDECVCKENVQGRYCDSCKNDSFYLSEEFRHGCALCFCSGVSQDCSSSYLRRKTTVTQFNIPQILQEVKIYKSSPAGPTGVRYTAPIESDYNPDSLLSSWDRSPTVYYWSLPSSFSGDKVTSYGGYLRYTLNNVPEYNSRTRNNAADVQLISDNQLTFHYSGNFTPSPNGIVNANIRMIEKEWRRSDSTEISREHFLLALADVKTILIKVRYADDAPLATPISASIDTAEANGNGPTAVEVEQCVCPTGYLGTSCEDCAPGYTRSSSGLYLKHCRPCDCNGHSNMCNPETGVCYSCADNTGGNHCELCKSGYQRDPYGYCVESEATTLTPCRCDPRGTETGCDGSGVCTCKQNVEGENCDRCRPGTFGLREDNPLGCLSCYCSGVATECHEGSHYASIPMAAPILEENYGGYTLMDLNANQVISDNFVPVPNQSELTYVFQYPPNVELYWSLPVFPGNRVLSYGGTLALRQSFYSTDNRTSSEPGVDVVLAGRDTSLFWTNPTSYNAGGSLSYQVPLSENGWFILGTTSPADRHTFMRVLADLRRVLVRATVSRNILYTAIADVSMDTATQNFDSSFPAATSVEVCMCPAGYLGSSCETCAPKHYKDRNNYCVKCPCNDHECQLDANDEVQCNCRPPYTGSDCSALGLVMELHPTIVDDSANCSRCKRVTFTCKYRAPEPLTIKFYHEGHEQWPSKSINESTLHKDGWHGEHVWHTVWDTNNQGEIYECHTVTQNGFTLGILTTSLPEPVGAPSVTQRPRPPVPQTTVVVTVTSPTIKIQEVGSSVNFTCEAYSLMTKNRLRVKWSKVAGQLPLDRSTVDEFAGLLLITNLQISDSGQYVCETNDGVSTAQAIATLKVPGNEMTMPVVEIRPAVQNYYVGDRIELECLATGTPAPRISWQRASGYPLPVSAEHFDELFIIDSAREEDSGEYRCIATNTLGSVDRTAIITISPRPSWPSRERLTISPTSLTLPEGQSSRVVCTGTQLIPAGSIDWIRQDGNPLSDNVQSINGVLYIEFARLEDQGVYLCQSSSPGVSPAQIVVKIEPLGTPSPSDISNINVSVERLSIPTGETGTVDCNPTGYPPPSIRWKKYDSDFGPSTSQRGNTLIVSNAQENDQGYYVCEGVVDSVTVASTYVFIGIEKREPPSVEIWPKGEQSVPIGSQFEFHCRTTGGIPEPALTWARGGSNRALSPRTHIRPNNLMFESVEVNDEGEYTCSATNVAGTASASAILKVRSPPEITITPNNQQEVRAGEPAIFECRANGYPEPTVSIKTSTDMLEIVRPTPGIAVLRITSASERDEGLYTCTATSPAGTTQEQFRLIVDRGDGGYPDFEGSGDEYEPERPQPPEYVETPSDLVALDGQREVTITCNVTGGLQARWDRTDRPLQRNAIERGSVLYIYNISTSDSGKYVCSLLDVQTGAVVRAVYTSLIVIGAPKITLRPQAQTVRPGQSPTVECVVEGDDIIDILWKPYNRAPSNRVEIRGSTLIFHQIEIEDAGKYECFARNRYANTSAIAEVVVSEESDRAPSQSHDNEQYAHSGAAVHLSCNVTEPNARIQWSKDGRPVPRSQQKSDGSLFIKLAQKSDSGRYECHIRDQYGRRTSNYINLHIEGIECLDNEFRCYDSSGCIDEALLCDDFQDCRDNSDENTCLYRHGRNTDGVWDDFDQFIPVAGPRDQGSASLVSIEQPRRRFRVSENVEVLCRANGINVKWERYGTNQYVDSRTYGDGAMLIIHGVQESDAGVYRCIGSGPYGSYYDDFNLEVEPSNTDPVYVDDRNSRMSEYTAQLRDSVDLPCNHNLEAPVAIEWKREFTPLPAEVRSNQPYLHLERVTEADAGIYLCRATNYITTVESRAVLRVERVVPRFDGSAWLSLPALKDAYRQFDIEISFNPADRDGLILYNSHNAGRTGDYVALSLVEGIPRFTLETGEGPIFVEGDRPLQLNVWHTIRVSRTNSRLTMDVDNTGPFTKESSEHWALLELEQPMYIGGVPDYDQLPVDLAGSSGFIGCVSMLILGREEKNIMLDNLEEYRVSACNSCSPNQCLNSGVCQEARNERGYMCICAPGFAGLNCDRTGEACRPGLCGPGKCSDTVDGYKCACPVAYTGKNCDVKQSIEYPAFTGSAYLAIKPPITSRSLRMSMKVKPTLPVTDGIIMYCAETSRGYGGFTSLAVRNGKLEFRYDLGRGNKPVVLTSNKTLPANEWTDVHIARLAAVVSLKINLVHNYERKLDRPSEILNLETPMFVGGVDDSIVLNNNTGVTGGFSGCIRDVMIYGSAVDIVNSSIQSANVRECINERGDIPDSDVGCQCYNGGTCPIDSTVCVCPLGFTGRQCETRVAAPIISSRLPSIPPSDPCSLRPCRNGGTCRPDLRNRMNHTCDCPLGYAGASCQMPLELLQSVGFNGNGYVELPARLLRYDMLHREPAVIALAIHTYNDGVLLYQREVAAPIDRGDYILIRVVEGFVELIWDLGSGPSNILIDSVIVNDGERHQIIAKLYEDNHASLSVDSATQTGMATGLSNLMNADSNIYIGGIPDSLNLLYNYPGLSGCIEQVELMSTDRGLNIGQVAVAGRNAQRCRDFIPGRA